MEVDVYERRWRHAARRCRQSTEAKGIWVALLVVMATVAAMVVVLLAFLITGVRNDPRERIRKPWKRSSFSKDIKGAWRLYLVEMSADESTTTWNQDPPC